MLKQLNKKLIPSPQILNKKHTIEIVLLIYSIKLPLSLHLLMFHRILLNLVKQEVKMRQLILNLNEH